MSLRDGVRYLKLLILSRPSHSVAYNFYLNCCQCCLPHHLRPTNNPHRKIPLWIIHRSFLVQLFSYPGSLFGMSYFNNRGIGDIIERSARHIFSDYELNLNISTHFIVSYNQRSIFKKHRYYTINSRNPIYIAQKMLP